MRKPWRRGLLYAGAFLTLVAFFEPGTAGLQENRQGEAAGPQDPPVQVFRMATLAPEGSDWADAAREAAHRIREETSGRVVLRWLFGAAMGDEATMLARIRQGSLEGGVLSMVGLTRAVPSMAFLSLPFLFRHEGEARMISERFAPDFQEGFLDKGLVLLGGFSLGFGRLFTTETPQTLEELTALRTWVWKGDALAETVFRALGFRNLVSLDMTDVLPALNYGLLDVFSGTCYTISIFQWFPHARNMVPLNWGNTFGGIVVGQEAFSRLSTTDREVLRRVTSELLLHMEADSLRKEEETLQVLKSSQGMGEIRLSPGDASLLEERAGHVYEIVAERVEARALLRSILRELALLRGKPPHDEPGGGSGPKI